MRLGFVTSLLWRRYGPFWHKLIAGANLETLLPEPPRVERALADPRLEGIPGLAFKLAAAQALSLEADVIVVPELNPGEEVARGSGQDPWIASFPEALAASLSGLPPLIAVPASLELSLETLAISTLHSLTRDPALVRRVWERTRSLAKPPKYPEPRWQPSTTVGVVAQPWLLGDALIERLGEGRHLVSQHRLSPALLREEGHRVDERLIGTDLEVLGAARYLGRKGSVASLIMVADRSSGADAWLLSRVERTVHKPLEVRSLHDVLKGDLAALAPTPL